MAFLYFVLGTAQFHSLYHSSPRIQFSPLSTNEEQKLLVLSFLAKMCKVFFYCSQTYTYIQIVASERSIIGLKLYYLHAIQRYKLALLFLNVMMGFSLCLRRGTPSKKIGPFLHFVAQVVMASVMCSLRACVRTLTASVSLAFFFCSVSIFFFSLLELTILWTKTNNNFVNVLYSFVQLGSNEFPQKRKVFFLLSWSIIKLEKNHWDCSGYKRTKWIYKNQHFTSWNKLLITNFSHWANKNLCIYWKKEWMFHVFHFHLVCHDRNHNLKCKYAFESYFWFFSMRRDFYGSDECDFFGHCNIKSNYIH